MTTSELTKSGPASGAVAAKTIEEVLLNGDLEKLSAEQRVAYLYQLCDALRLNPLTRPFQYVRVKAGEGQMKLIVYATKDCTEQLRSRDGISITIVSRDVVEGCYVVVARATDRTGRSDESIGVTPIEGQKGEYRSNAMMKAETKAKRRVTLSICGLGMLDESETDSIPGAVKVEAEVVKDDLEKKLQASIDATAVTPMSKVAGRPKSNISETEAEKLATASREIGKIFTALVDTGEAPTKDEFDSLVAEIRGLKWSKPKVGSFLKHTFGVEGVNSLTRDQVASAMKLLKAAAVDDLDATYALVYEELQKEGKVK